jgi:hypothetical protein
VNTKINSTGSIKSVSVGAMQNSQVFAGVGTLPGGQVLPQSNSDFTAGVAINSFKVHRAAGVSASFVNSVVAAPLIKSADLGSVQLNNGGTPFGVASEDMKSLVLRDSISGRQVKVKNTIDQATLDAQTDASGVALQDLVLRITT